MGSAEPQNPAYRHCFVDLTENDREMLLSLRDIPIYRAVIDRMLDEGVKLEQDIICSDLMGT